MIRSGLILMIKDLAGKGKSAYAIGQEIGISKNTARKYMEQADRQHGLKGISKGSKLDPYKPQLNEWMGQGIFNCVVLLERLRELGYDGGISILKAYVHPYRPAKAAPAVRRYETPRVYLKTQNCTKRQEKDIKGFYHRQYKEVIA